MFYFLRQPHATILPTKNIPGDLKNKSGIYVFVGKDSACESRVMYVGQSCNLKSRLTSHRIYLISPWYKWTDVSVHLYFEDNLLDCLESRLIWYFKPPFNNHIPKIGEGELRENNRDIRGLYAAMALNDKVIQRLFDIRQRLAAVKNEKRLMTIYKNKITVLLQEYLTMQNLWTQKILQAESKDSSANTFDYLTLINFS